MKRDRLRARGPLPLLCLLTLLSASGVALAQQAVGVVTALKGKAQLTRATTKTALRFKDDLILRDLIDTQEKSLTRVLFGGKSTVTVRELSRLEVREELLPGGTTRTVHDLSSGSILVNVARSLMRRGDEVQIRTPNAVAAVRGSTVFAQYNAALAQSVFVLLTGSAVVTPQGQPSITLTPNTSVNVTGTAATGVQVGPVGTVTQAEANGIVEGSEVGTGGVTEESAEAGVVEATQLAEAVVAAVAEPVLTTIAESPPGEAIDETPVVEVTSEEPAPSTGEGSISKEAAAARVLPFVFRKDTTSSDTPFIQVTNETVDKTVDLITVNSGVTVTLDGKLLVIDPSTITTTGSLLRITGASLTLGGSLLTAKNSTITADTLFDVSSKSTLTNTVGPVIKITGGTFDAFALLEEDESGNTFKFTGTLLDLTDTKVTLEFLEDESTVGPDVDTFTLSLADNEPMFRVNNSTLAINNTSSKDPIVILAGEDFSGGTFPGVGLIATNNSTITNKGGALVDFEGILETTTTDPLVQITDSTVSTDVTSMFEVVPPPPSGSTSVTMAGPLLKAQNSTLKTNDQSFARVNNSTVVLDLKLVAATLPVFDLVDSTVNDITGSAFADINSNSQFTVTGFSGGLIALDNSLIKVIDAPLLNITGGSTLTVGTAAVKNPLLNLTNASKITVLNRPLIFVSGTGSKLTVNGVLAAFGSGANQIVVTNSVSPSDVLSNLKIPVKQPTLGDITIGDNAVTGSGSVQVGTSLKTLVTVDGVNGLSNFSASLIEVSGGGKVVITP